MPRTAGPALIRPGTSCSRPNCFGGFYETNKYVNDRVAWTSDDALYGKAERWTLPLDRGDCEDIVLLKRKMLAKLGWPQGSLLITTVEEPGPAKGRHAVLTVRSDRGEMILDNQTRKSCSGTRPNTATCRGKAPPTRTSGWPSAPRQPKPPAFPVER